MGKEKPSIKDLSRQDIESGSYKNNPEMLKEEGEAMDESTRIMHKLVFEKQATVEIKNDAFGNKVAVVTHENHVIYSTDKSDEVQFFELFLEDPEAASTELRKRLEIARAEQSIIEEISRKFEDEPEE